MSTEGYALIGSLANIAGLIFIAWLNNRSNRKVIDNVKIAVEKVEKVEHATNSMKDKLIANALVEGEQTGKDKQIALQQEIKQEVKEGIKEQSK